METKEILIKARKLIEDEKNWGQRSYNHTNMYDEECFCSVGAISQVMFGRAKPNQLNEDEQKSVKKVLDQMVCPMGIGGVIKFNDSFMTDHKDVLKMFDRSIRKNLFDRTLKMYYDKAC